MVKCQICKRDEACSAFQPFGPDEKPHKFMMALGYHYRGFPVIKSVEVAMTGLLMEGWFSSHISMSIIIIKMDKSMLFLVMDYQKISFRRGLIKMVPERFQLTSPGKSHGYSAQRSRLKLWSVRFWAVECGYIPTIYCATWSCITRHEATRL